MEQFLFKIIHIGIPLIIIVVYKCAKPKSQIGIILSGVLYVSILSFLMLWGQWPIAISLYYKYLVLAIVLYIILKSVKEHYKAKSFYHGGVISNIRNVLTLILGGLFSYLIINLLSGLSYPNGAIDLEFPLKNGRYYIASGGSNKLANNHTRNVPTSQQYAIDINKIGKWGTIKISRGNKNEAHAIFGESIYCPCSGVVSEVITGVSDNAGSSMAVNQADGSGNYVEVNCDDVIISFSHLKLESVSLIKGQNIRLGDLVGTVGNSGFSQEPHLHFQAARYTKDSILVGIPMRFNNKFLYRNNVYKAE